MEARVAKLEAQMEHVVGELGKLAAVPADIAGMKSDISHLPTKDYIANAFDKHFRWTVGTVGLMIAVAGLIIKVA